MGSYKTVAFRDTWSKIDASWYIENYINYGSLFESDNFKSQSQTSSTYKNFATSSPRYEFSDNVWKQGIEIFFTKMNIYRYDYVQKSNCLIIFIICFAKFYSRYNLFHTFFLAKNLNWKNKLLHWAIFFISLNENYR